MRVNVIHFLGEKKTWKKSFIFGLSWLVVAFPRNDVYTSFASWNFVLEITHKSCHLCCGGIQLQIYTTINISKDVWVQISHKNFCVTFGCCFTHIFVRAFMGSTRWLRVRICHQHLWYCESFRLNIPLNPFPRNL